MAASMSGRRNKRLSFVGSGRLECEVGPKLDHALRSIMEQITNEMEGQCYGHETTATQSSLQAY